MTFLPTPYLLWFFAICFCLFGIKVKIYHLNHACLYQSPPFCALAITLFPFCSSPPERFIFFFLFTLICSFHLIQLAILFPFHFNTWITSYFCTDGRRQITAMKRWQTPELKIHELTRLVWKQEAQYPNLAVTVIACRREENTSCCLLKGNAE